jgi:lipopolysaccharide biosynthesis glycosyltransferase
MFLYYRIWFIDQNLMENKAARVRRPEKAEPIHLVYASDDDQLPGVEASIRSVMCHASEPVVFHYIGDTPVKSLPQVKYYNLTEVSQKYKLEDFTNPTLRHDVKVQGLNSNLANYARFVIHELLPNQSKAMWVDVDTIVRCDVVPMVRKALSSSDYVIAAVPKETGRPRGFEIDITKELYMKDGFNAGVFVVDLDRWRSQHMTNEIRHWTLRNRKEQLYKLGSQAPMILVFHDNFEHMAAKWNTKVSHIDDPEKRDDASKACLFHWSGPGKPWNEDGIHKDLWVPCPKNKTKSS